MKNAELKQRLYTIIFGTETRAGKLFDLALIVVILASVLALMAESVVTVSGPYFFQIRMLEWAFTILFTIEYAAD